MSKLSKSISGLRSTQACNAQRDACDYQYEQVTKLEDTIRLIELISREANEGKLDKDMVLRKIAESTKLILDSLNET